MRLLNVRTLELKRFDDDNLLIPRYVIASHRWFRNAEPTMRDVENKTNTDTKGYEKLLGFVNYVKEHLAPIEWLWIDTCCINQENAAELSEAVNLMFDWYSNAVVCLAYLSDVDIVKDMESFEESEWFERGWTLQELLAPRIVIFLTRTWQVIGNKGYNEHGKSSITVGQSLERRIATITGIPEPVLHRYETGQGLSVTEKLKWFGSRVTTREEDKWYCLYGLFDISPGANYGEKSRGAETRFHAALRSTTGSYLDTFLRRTIPTTTRTPTPTPIPDTNNHITHDDYHSDLAKSEVMDLLDFTEEEERVEGDEADEIADEEADEGRLDCDSNATIDLGSSVETQSQVGGDRIGLRTWGIAILVALTCICWALFFTLPDSSQPAFRPEINASLPVFAILGKTGVGKSTFITTLGGLNVKSGASPEVCDGLDSCTDETSLFIADLPFGQAYLIDTPGFDDSKGRDDTVVLNMIFEELKELYNGDKLLKGIIYLYDISSSRIGGTTKNLLVEIQQLCGLNCIRNMMLVTTRWTNTINREELTKQSKREQELKDNYWKDALRHGSSIERYRGTKESGYALLGILNDRERLFDFATLHELLADLKKPYNEKPDDPTSNLPGLGNSSSILQMPHWKAWRMESASIICSSPFSTFFAMLGKIVLALLLQGVILILLSKPLQDYLTGAAGPDGEDMIIYLFLAVAAWGFTYLLGSLNVGRLRELPISDGSTCMLLSWSIHNWPAYAFCQFYALSWVFMVFSCWTEMNNTLNRIKHGTMGKLVRIVPPVLVFAFLEYLLMC